MNKHLLDIASVLVAASSSKAVDLWANSQIFRMLRDIATPDTSFARISLAIQWIRRNFAKPLRVEALAELAALGAFTFHRHFKAVTALSPLQYQKRMRLLQARSMPIAGEGNATSVAFGVG